MVQVLKEARAIDDAYDAGLDIKPLCGMAFVVKDNLDVLGYAFHNCSDQVVVTMRLSCICSVWSVQRLVRRRLCSTGTLQRLEPQP